MSLELAEELEARAAALRDEERLKDDLKAAKQAYADNPTDETKTAKQAAMEALRDCRSRARTEGVTVGGDAYVDKEV
ncbi:hypothetical protein ACQEUU_37315 [Nonomuraea sp. CA-218870]|uniref:hypothetical protein n=1 Tax=Nonomuraea sp. CA-218870 TaxID=3239998 RepID=UPI003D945080